MEALSQKRKIQADHRASITPILRQVTAELAKTPPDSDKFDLLKLTLSEKVQTLKTLYTDLSQKIVLKKIFRSLMTAVSATMPDPAPAGTPREYGAKATLSKLSLPHFNGSYC